MITAKSPNNQKDYEGIEEKKKSNSKNIKETINKIISYLIIYSFLLVQTPYTLTEESPKELSQDKKNN